LTGRRRAHARPRHREAVGVEAEVLHQGDIVAEAVVVVARDVTVVGADHGAGHAAEGVPDGCRAAVLEGGAFDLVGGGGRAEEEALRRSGELGHESTF
jgi:hypothetical protein